MPKKDVCYVATDALKPKYLKGQIIAIKDPGLYQLTDKEENETTQQEKL